MNNLNEAKVSPFLASINLFKKLTGREIELLNTEIVIVEIYVTGEFSNPVDSDVVGVYIMEVDPTVSKEKFADVALDAFHASVPISTMEDFYFVVTRNDEVLRQDPKHLTGSFAQNAVLVNKVFG